MHNPRPTNISILIYNDRASNFITLIILTSFFTFPFFHTGNCDSASSNWISNNLGEISSSNLQSSSTIPPDKSSNLSKHPVLLVISFDGFRHDYFHRAATPFLDLLKEDGSSVPYMKNQFVTKTFPNHMSIATG